jgi:hypothetical protein
MPCLDAEGSHTSISAYSILQFFTRQGFKRVYRLTNGLALNLTRLTFLLLVDVASPKNTIFALYDILVISKLLISVTEVPKCPTTRSTLQNRPLPPSSSFAVQQ